MMRNTTAHRVYPPNTPYIRHPPLLFSLHTPYDRGARNEKGIRPVALATRNLDLYGGLRILYNSREKVNRLTLFLNRELAQQIESDLLMGNQQVIEAWQTFDAESPIQIMKIDDAQVVYGGPACPINEAVGLGMTSEVNVETLEKVERFYATNNHPSVIRVCPLAHASLVDILRDRNYSLSAFSYRWILDLSAWKSPYKEVDARIRMANASEEMTWARTVSAGFSDEDDPPSDDDLHLERAFFRMSGGVPVLGVERDEPAAAGMLAMNGYMAALFTTSTRPSFRERGLQSALLDWRLRHARQHGMRLATIETDPGSPSQRNVERMGFRLAYVTAEMTKQMKDEEEVRR